MNREPLSILKALGAPAFDTLPAEWRQTVRNLERTIQAQATALQACEQVIVGAVSWAEAGQIEAAVRTLRDGHARIAASLDSCNQKADSVLSH